MPETPSPHRAPLPRNVKVLSAVSFLQDTASEMLYPVLPLFLTGTLGAAPAVLGLIEGVAEATASAGKVVSGRLADRLRRRPMIAAGYGLSALAKPLIGLAQGWGLVLVARFADRSGKAIRTPPRDALIAADTPAAIRGRAFGFHRACDTAGAVLGPLLGLALYELLDERLRPLFFVAFVPAALSVALIALVRDRPPPAAADPAALVPLGALPAGFWRLVAVLSVFGLANFSDAFLILRASELGLGFVSVMLVYVLYNAAYALVSYPAGHLSDRVPRRLVYGSGLVVFALAYVGLGLAPSAAWVWLLLPLYGCYAGLTDGVSKAWVSDLLPERALGTGMGLFQGAAGACALVAGIWAGLAWGEDGSLPLIVAGAVAAVVAAVVLADRGLDGPGAR